ncbi:hypothetical protein F5Y06DRAFT_256067 [Hypoxylon sp. FL0890]|nr:hypothetical protein F5Y06DRAFT_256067 [Hypoxylon sp. FL0890]
MTYGEKPEAHIDSSPKVSAFKANFIHGGLVFIMHHYYHDRGNRYSTPDCSGGRFGMAFI